MMERNAGLVLSAYEIPCPRSWGSNQIVEKLPISKLFFRFGCSNKQDLCRVPGCDAGRVRISRSLIPGNIQETYRERSYTEDEANLKLKLVRTLLIDNYDSYTYNIYQELSTVNGVPPVVVHNDKWTWETFHHYLYGVKAFDNIVISPGPGSPTCQADIGVCLRILHECKDIPILGVCLGHQALGYVHGARIMHAPTPVHGSLSEIQHNGCNLFHDIPSGSKSGFNVVQYHSLVIDAKSLPEELIPIAWTTSENKFSFFDSQESAMDPAVLRSHTDQRPSFGHTPAVRKVASSKNDKNFDETENPILMGIMHSTRPHYGVQFHPESVATSYGRQIFENFKNMTVDYWLRSSHSHDLKVHSWARRQVSHSSRLTEKPPKSKLQDANAASRPYSDSCKKSSHGCKIINSKLLKLQWKKFDCLANRVGGSGNIFCKLFGDLKAKDTFWLDSSSVDKKRARFSFMGGKGGSLWRQITFWLSDQRNMTAVGGGYLSIEDGQGSVETTFLEDGFLDFLSKELESFVHVKEDYEGLPFDFCGGYVGFIGYNLKVECGASSNRHISKTPDACFFFADNLVVVDHSNGDVYILSLQNSHHPETARDGPQKSLTLLSWMDETEKRLLSLKSTESKKYMRQNPQQTIRTPSGKGFAIDKSKDQYMKDVEKCLEFIRDGESYELCLTTQMRKRLEEIDPLGLHLSLRDKNPAPYAAWLSFSKVNLCICCSSPERFLQLDRNGILEAKPIKGTIARGATREEDEKLRLQLLHSEKDQAENLMIVDLLRNDLGRVCEPGSVHVPRLMDVESYATVHTMVSTIQGKKKPKLSPIDCIRAAFPGGSMTGAPKLRSMELLDSLEGCSRGVYSGSIGFLSYNQTFDLNIVIRTIVIHEDEASIGAGGAVVALSNPEDEYEEMKLKAQAPVKTVMEIESQSDSFDRASKTTM